ncbi:MULTISPECIES: DUF222 domain-containing protein [unclassified Brevibacterium]|uniref:HNH endonuclease n=1 Tax=unclassified Brevibacterium TaxID=2614124 RepID=UPI0020178164|nr:MULTISPECIES: DUF222 domain-containing protein [unclassified Brevibacterium]MCM1012016.1 DUF222 domain-containing protein [Brevibacterium sp. XM4083]
MESETVSDVIADIVRWREALSALPPATTEREAIERITALEELTSAAAAAQAREALTFDMHRRNREAEDGVPSARQGRGVGAEVGLARKVSRARGSKLIGFARTLLMDLPHTYSALSQGQISEEKAQAVARESSWLPREKKQELDAQMADRLAEVGVGRLSSEVRMLAQKLDQVAAVDHLDHCTTERRVTVRPAPGNMAYLTAFLPMQQAVAAFANLSTSAATRVGTGESGGSTQSQTMADLLVERVTGQESAEAVPLDVLVVMNDETMFDVGDDPAWLPGFGPIPAGAARSLIAENDASVFLRRLYTRPADGQLVAMDSKRREFGGLLRQMVLVRDDVCRTPWCDALIRHVDHATPVADGGATTWGNASGLCAACNYTKELAGWRHRATAEELIVTTPTGHRYTMRTRPIDSRRSSVGRQPDAGARKSAAAQPGAGRQPDAGARKSAAAQPDPGRKQDAGAQPEAERQPKTGRQHTDERRHTLEPTRGDERAGERAHARDPGGVGNVGEAETRGRERVTSEVSDQTNSHVIWQIVEAVPVSSESRWRITDEFSAGLTRGDGSVVTPHDRERPPDGRCATSGRRR